MPVTCRDPSMAGAAFEALSSSNYNVLVPVYFEVALKTKYAYDSGSARMYDLIRSTMKPDFGFVYNNAVGNPLNTPYTAITGNGSIASALESTRKNTLAKLDSYLENIKNNCE